MVYPPTTIWWFILGKPHSINLNVTANLNIVCIFMMPSCSTFRLLTERFVCPPHTFVHTSHVSEADSGGGGGDHLAPPWRILTDSGGGDARLNALDNDTIIDLFADGRPRKLLFKIKKIIRSQDNDEGSICVLFFFIFLLFNCSWARILCITPAER